MNSRLHSPRAIALRDENVWRRFTLSTPALNEVVQIRRLHDNKTILRRRADLPATFVYRSAEWRPL